VRILVIHLIASSLLPLTLLLVGKMLFCGIECRNSFLNGNILSLCLSCFDSLLQESARVDMMSAINISLLVWLGMSVFSL
jgi:hypothetical protein